MTSSWAREELVSPFEKGELCCSLAELSSLLLGENELLLRENDTLLLLCLLPSPPILRMEALLLASVTILQSEIKLSYLITSPITFPTNAIKQIYMIDIFLHASAAKKSCKL